MCFFKTVNYNFFCCPIKGIFFIDLLTQRENSPANIFKSQVSFGQWLIFWNFASVDVILKPAGDAPIMKKKKWAVERNKKVAYISDFIKKFIKSESIFLYVNQSFSPSPDTEVGCVFDCFGSDGKLVLHYCRTQAWGWPSHALRNCLKLYTDRLS